MVNSIRKGKNGEREIANWLSNITNKKWQRVPCSGGLFTSRGATDFKGDVYCEDPAFSDIVVEVKNYKTEVTINDLTTNKSSFWGWLTQTRVEAGNSPWILFFKSKGKWFMICDGIDVYKYSWLENEYIESWLSMPIYKVNK